VEREREKKILLLFFFSKIEKKISQKTFAVTLEKKERKIYIS